MTKGKWTVENFEKYDEDHPDVWIMFERYALVAALAGHTTQRKVFSIA